MRTNIVCTIGTDHHQFGRLLDWLDDWLEAHPQYRATTLVQHGQSRPSRLARNRSFIPWAELVEMMANCQVVITHAGPASLFEARAAGHLPICVPRDPGLEEIVDAHQQRFARLLARDELVALCENRADFEAALNRFVTDPASQVVEYDQNRVARTVANLDTIMAEFAAKRTRRRR